MKRLKPHTHIDIKSEPPRISKFLYIFSIALLCCYLIYTLIHFFTSVSDLWQVLFFIAIIGVAIVSRAFGEEGILPDEEYKTNWFDTVLNFIIGIAIIGSVLSGIYMFFVSGNPEKIQDSYYIVNHGDIVRLISYKEFLFYSFCEKAMFHSILLLFCSFLAKRVHALFSIQNGKLIESGEETV